jgi:hypothetical protein
MASKHNQNSTKQLLSVHLPGTQEERGPQGNNVQNVEAGERMPKPWALVEAGERDGDLKSPIGEGMEI